MLVGHPIIKSLWYKPPVSNSHPPRNILVALGHAGDWCALINRSDPDHFIQDIVQVAKFQPDFNFVIRPHPTMTHPKHDGVNSLNRLKSFISNQKLKNVYLSVDDIEVDVQKAEVIISEYSQVLMDGLADGKLVISHNPTNRRSFFAVFEEHGVHHSTSKESLATFLNEIKHNLHDVFARQHRAVEALNTSNWGTASLREQVPLSPVTAVTGDSCPNPSGIKIHGLGFDQTKIIKIQKEIHQALRYKVLCK